MAADWDDIRVYLALAREGTLTAAANRLGVSHPTIGRRIKSLETTLGVRLFDQLPDRFALTAAGEDFMVDAQAMEQAAESIERRSAGLGDTTYGTVRISAGEEMAAFLACRLDRLRRNSTSVEIELVNSHLMANLSRREADLMIREDVPDLAGIVTRKLGRVGYAVYGSPVFGDHDLSREVMRRLPWCGFDEDHSYMPGQAWLRDLLGQMRPEVRVTNWLILKDVAGAGIGLAVLPCYLGDGDPRLRRLTPLLPGVVADQWLVVHRDLRILRRIRAVMDGLVELFEAERSTIEGVANAALPRPLG